MSNHDKMSVISVKSFNKVQSFGGSYDLHKPPFHELLKVGSYNKGDKYVDIKIVSYH